MEKKDSKRLLFSCLTLEPNPASSLILSPAGRTVRFDQEMIEGLVRMSGAGFVSEVHGEHGKGAPIQLSKATPIQLKGVPYGARMSAKITVKGERRETGLDLCLCRAFPDFHSLFDHR